MTDRIINSRSHSTQHHTELFPDVYVLELSSSIGIYWIEQSNNSNGSQKNPYIAQLYHHHHVNLGNCSHPSWYHPQLCEMRDEDPSQLLDDGGEPEDFSPQGHPKLAYTRCCVIDIMYGHNYTPDGKSESGPRDIGDDEVSPRDSPKPATESHTLASSVEPDCPSGLGFDYVAIVDCDEYYVRAFEPAGDDFVPEENMSNTAPHAAFDDPFMRLIQERENIRARQREYMTRRRLLRREQTYHSMGRLPWAWLHSQPLEDFPEGTRILPHDELQELSIPNYLHFRQQPQSSVEGSLGFSCVAVIRRNCRRLDAPATPQPLAR